ncbi:hypothetical protein HYV71_01155 [Candidatus Uhrbacteria bacterium]|nr:hypothetical protein [Candidatus Uhrbacteria bacterium]
MEHQRINAIETALSLTMAFLPLRRAVQPIATTFVIGDRHVAHESLS